MNKPTAAKSSNSAPRPPAKKRPLLPQSKDEMITLQQRHASQKASQLAPSAKNAMPTKTSTPWTVEAASRIYRTEVQRNNGQVPKGSLGAKAMSAATKTALHLKPREK